MYVLICNQNLHFMWLHKYRVKFNSLKMYLVTPSCTLYKNNVLSKRRAVVF